MLIEKRTESSLNLKIIPLSIWFLGMVCIMASISIVTQVDYKTILSCTRINGEGKCKIYSEKLISSKAKELIVFDVQKLLEAKIETSNSNTGKKKSATYRIALKTSDGMIPLSNSFTTEYAKKEKAVKQIQAFINNLNINSLQVQNDASLFILLSCLIFFGAGILLIFSGKIIILSFDKKTNKTDLIWQGILGSKTLTCNVSDIVEARSVVCTTPMGTNRYSFSSSNRSQSTYRDVLVTSSGEEIPLTSYCSSNTLGGLLSLFGKKSTVEEINSFLKKNTGDTSTTIR